jgi:hypothetical protein
MKRLQRGNAVSALHCLFAIDVRETLYMGLAICSFVAGSGILEISMGTDEDYNKQRM